MKIRLREFRDDIFDELVTYGSNNITLIDKICALLLALSPILQHYKGVYLNAGFSVLLLISPYVMMKLVVKLMGGRHDSKCFGAIIPLLFFQLYKMVDHGASGGKILYGFFMLMIFTAVAYGCINIKCFVKYAAVISVTAGILLILQYICFYLLHFHLQLVPSSLLLPESSAWISGVQTGLYGLRGVKNGFYRPSAFFLEPSHLFIYTFPTLCILLLSPNMNKKRIRMAILISIGMILSTSGMGVVIAIGVWIVYFALYRSNCGKENVANLKNLFSGKNVLMLVAIVAVLIFAYFRVEVFRSMISRIFSSGSAGGSTAIDGRTRLARMLVGGLSGTSLLFGLTEDVSDINFNLSGFYSTLYKYGLVGVALSYLFYASGIFKLKGAYFWMTLIIVVISFFTAHTHGTFYMLYYVIVIVNGYHMMKRHQG